MNIIRKKHKYHKKYFEFWKKYVSYLIKCIRIFQNDKLIISQISKLALLLLLYYYYSNFTCEISLAINFHKRRNDNLE